MAFTRTADPTAPSKPWVGTIPGNSAYPLWAEFDTIGTTPCGDTLSALGCSSIDTDIDESLTLTEDLATVVTEGCPDVATTQTFSSYGGIVRQGAAYIPITDANAPGKLVFHMDALPNPRALTYAVDPFTSWSVGATIATSTAFYDVALDYTSPGIVHVLHTHSPAGTNNDTRVLYRKANFTSGYTLTAAVEINGTANTSHGLGNITHRSNGQLWVVYQRSTAAGHTIHAGYSDDVGVTWNLAEVQAVPASGSWQFPFIAIVNDIPVAIWAWASGATDLQLRAKTYTSGTSGNAKTLTNLGAIVGTRHWITASYDGLEAGVIGFDSGTDAARFVKLTVSGTGVITESAVELPGATRGGLGYVTMTATQNGKYYVPFIDTTGTAQKGVRSAAGVWTVSAQTKLVAPTTSSNRPSSVQAFSCAGTVYTYCGPNAGDPDTLEVFSEDI